MPTATADAAYENLVTAFTTEKTVTSSQMFGKACLKVDGKAFVSLHDDTVVFKLSGEQHRKAMTFKNAKLWDPSGNGRPMKEWVALPVAEARAFRALAASAFAYVASAK